MGRDEPQDVGVPVELLQLLVALELAWSSASISASRPATTFLYFRPRLIDRLEGLSFPMQFRRTPIRVTIEGGELTFELLGDGFSLPIRVGLGDDIRKVGPDEPCTFTLAQASGVAR